MKKKLALAVAMLFASATVLSGCGNSSAEGNKNLSLASGGPTGTYYAVGGVMTTVLNPKLQTCSLTVNSTGASQANVQLIDEGDADLAIVQNDVMSYALKGTDLFEAEGAYKNFSAVTGLYNETCQIIATPNIKSVEDLRGKTVSVGDAGSGVGFNARQILEAYDMTFDDINVVNSGFGDSADGIKDGKIDAAFITAGAPTTAVVDLSTTKQINIIEIDDAHADKLIEKYPFYTKQTIPAGTYSSVKEDVKTVAVRAALIASNDVPEDMIYELTKALFENHEELVGSHDKFTELSIEQATAGIDVPLHPGAEKYFKEAGIL